MAATHALARRGADHDSKPSSAAPDVASGQAGMPAYLRAVQQKCDSCAGASDGEERPLQQKGEAAGPGVGGGEAGGASRASSGIHNTAAQGVARADAPLPGAARIQAAFGRHDVSGVRAQVGGPAAQASQRMGARAYTVGQRIGFKSEPDIKLAAHEAAHTVQQRQGVRLKDGVGRMGDEYEQQADAVAERVAANQSAEDLLDDNVGQQTKLGVQAQCACGGTCAQCNAEAKNEKAAQGVGGTHGAAGATGAVQMDLEANAMRQFEPTIANAAGAPSAVGSGGAGKAGADSSSAAAGNAGDGGKSEADATSDEAADAAPGGPASGAANAGAAGSGAAPGGGAGTGAGAGAGAGPGASAMASGCTPACYVGQREKPATPPDPVPPDPAPAPISHETNAGQDPEALEPDNCQAALSQGPGGAVPAAPAAGATAPPGAAAVPAAPATPSASPTAAAGGGAGSSSGGGGGGVPAAPMESMGSPMDAVLAAAEGQRGVALASYSASRGALDMAGGGTSVLRAGTAFAAQAGEGVQAQTQRSVASQRADSFFSDAADRLDGAIAMANGPIPDQLGVAAESAKAQIAAALESQKGSISARIEQARAQARGDAAMASGAVRQQAASATADARQQTATAIAALQTAHRAAGEQVTQLETTTLEQINQTYARGRTDLEGLGTTIGDECAAKGRDFATTYQTFQSGTNGCSEDGFWDGNLAERRANAQAKAAREVANGKRDRMVDGAKTQARAATRDARKTDRCLIINMAQRSHATLDQSLASLVPAFESTRDAAIAKAASTLDALLGSIQSSLTGTLAQLDQQEQAQRQLADDTAYMQQVLQEQIAHSAVAAIQQAVAGAVSSALSALTHIQAQCSASAPPDLALLDRVLAQVGQRINSALGGLGSSAQGGAALAQSQLAGAAQQGLDALAGVTQGNDAQAQGASDGFATGMSTLAGNDNFAAQRAALTQQVTQSSAAGSAEFAKAVTGMQNSCTNTLTQATTALTKAHTDLETNLKQQRQGLECEITSAANLAASHEAPAWKRWIAVALIILVVVIIIAVIIVSGGTALGPLIAATGPILAAAIVGAAVGAVTSGLIYAATNLWSNTDLTWGGLGTAVAVGAVTGAIGGGLGAWAGAAVGGWTGVVAGARLTATQLAAQLASASVVAAGVDAATQFYMGGFSFEHYSAAQLGVTLFVTVVTFGIGHVTARAPVAPVVETPPAPLPPSAPPTPEPTIGFGRTPAPRPAGAPPTPEPTIGFGRTPAPRPAGTAIGPASGGGLGPTVMAPEPVVLGPRATVRAGTPGALLEGNAPRAMASTTEPGVTQPVVGSVEPVAPKPMAPAESVGPSPTKLTETAGPTPATRPQRSPAEIEAMTNAELNARIRETPKTNNPTDESNALRYARYLRKGGTQGFDEWFGGSRGGRPGSPEHQADVLANNGPPNNLEPSAVGNRVPDGVGEPGQTLTIRGQSIKPVGRGRVIVESDHVINNGTMPNSDARAQMRAIRAADPDATLVVTDLSNPSAPPLVYPPGTQPPPPGRLPTNQVPIVPSP